MGDARFIANSYTTESAIRQLFSLGVMAEDRTPDFDDAWIAYSTKLEAHGKTIRATSGSLITGLEVEVNRPPFVEGG